MPSKEDRYLSGHSNNVHEFKFVLMTIQLLVPIVAIIILLPSIGIEPIADDYRNIETAKEISVWAIFRDLKYGSMSGPHYRPMEPLSYRGDYVLSHFLPWSPMFTNLLIHALASWLVFQVTTMLTGAVQIGLTAGILFAIHPAAASSVVWISGRTTGLVCVFLLLSIWLYLKYREQNNRSYLVMSIIAFGFGLFSKEQAYLFPVFLLALTFAISAQRVSSKPLFWYVALEILVIFFGLLPSGVLVKETYISNPFSLGDSRLAEDIFVLCSIVGVIDFRIRDALLSIAATHNVLICLIWFACCLILIAPLIIPKYRKQYFCVLIWICIGLAPLRGMSPNIFTYANVYLIVPVLALGASLMLRWLYGNFRLAALLVSAGTIFFFSVNLIIAQSHFMRMGNFNKSLHSILKGSSMEAPGALRLILNLPDPFRTTTLDRNFAHFLTFRIVQSAWKFGGYSEKKTKFVEQRVLQTIAAEYDNRCKFEATEVTPNSVSINLIPKDVSVKRCLSNIGFIDFDGEFKNEENMIIAKRQSEFEGYPITKAEIYFFDGQSLNLVYPGNKIKKR